MDGSGSEAALKDLVRRLFDGPGDEELPAYEKKSYFLTAPNLDEHHTKLIETMAAIANGGFQAGLILCSGDGEPDQLIDAEQLDVKMRAVVGPAIRFTLSRQQVAGRTIDLITIPRSTRRPHIMRDRVSNRFYFPLRGAANNVTAARHELDDMMRDQLVETLRQAFPSLHVDALDATTRYAQEIGYGFNTSDDGPQIAILVIPEPLRERISSATFNDNEQLNNRRLFELMTETVNVGNPDYYTIAGALSTRYGEDYCELFEASVGSAPQVKLWANRIYVTGAIIRQSRLWQATMHGHWTIEWLVKEIEASFRFARFAFSKYHVDDFDQVRIMLALKGAGAYPIAVHGALGFGSRSEVLPPGFDDPLVLPKRAPLTVPRLDFLAQSEKIATDLGRAVRVHYEP